MTDCCPARALISARSAATAPRRSTTSPAASCTCPTAPKFEAHSGLGNLLDDPAHVNARNAGATPPGIYEMKPREKLFHGVPALRMTPVDGSETFGRVGLLVHSYMLGPNGDSNGCISVKHYDKFLQAYRSGTIKRIAVVISIKDTQSASSRSPSNS